MQGAWADDIYTHTILVRNPGSKRIAGRLRRMLQDDAKCSLRMYDVDWIHRVGTGVSDGRLSTQ